MGQKANLLTLKKQKKDFNLVNLDTKVFLYSLQFLKYFETLLNKKNILIIKKTLYFLSSCLICIFIWIT